MTRIARTEPSGFFPGEERLEGAARASSRSSGTSPRRAALRRLAQAALAHPVDALVQVHLAVLEVDVRPAQGLGPAVCRGAPRSTTPCTISYSVGTRCEPPIVPLGEAGITNVRTGQNEPHAVARFTLLEQSPRRVRRHHSSAPRCPRQRATPAVRARGQSTTSVRGEESMQARYDDDGDTLVCHVEGKGKNKLTEVLRYSRPEHTIRIEQDGKVLTRHVPKGAMVLDYLCWQELIVAAGGIPRSDDADSRTGVRARGRSVDRRKDPSRYCAQRGPLRDALPHPRTRNGLPSLGGHLAGGAVEHVRSPGLHFETTGHAMEALVEDAGRPGAGPSPGR